MRGGARPARRGGCGGCNGGTVDKHALKRDAEKVGSLASEGELLANDMSKGASTKYFARVHAKELSQAAADLADALGKRPDVAWNHA